MFGRILIIAVIAVMAWAVFAHGSSGAGHPLRYVVKPTDTLWSIAQHHYVGDPREGIWKLQQANHLQGTQISPGESLLVP